MLPGLPRLWMSTAPQAAVAYQNSCRGRLRRVQPAAWSPGDLELSGRRGGVRAISAGGTGYGVGIEAEARTEFEPGFDEMALRMEAWWRRELLDRACISVGAPNGRRASRQRRARGIPAAQWRGAERAQGTARGQWRRVGCSPC